MALYKIQRKKTPHNPSPDHNPEWDLTWWDNQNATWVDTQEEGSTHTTVRGHSVIAECGLREGTPGDEVTLIAV